MPGANNGHLDYMDGFLYVAARGANQIYKISLTGEVTLFAGTGQQAVKDGPALQASFSLPNAVTFSPNANAFYTNGSGGVIRKIQLEATGLSEINELNPSSFSLEQNYPNPFNPSTTIKYSIPETEFVSLKLFDVIGNEVAILVDGMKSAATYRINFSAEELTSGIYFYVLKAGDYINSKKLIIMK